MKQERPRLGHLEEAGIHKRLVGDTLAEAVGTKRVDKGREKEGKNLDKLHFEGGILREFAVDMRLEGIRRSPWCKKWNHVHWRDRSVLLDD